MPGTLKLNSGGAGNLILTPSGSVGSDVTVTLPAATATLAINGPAFSAYLASTYASLTSNTWYKVPAGSESYDTASCYNTSTYRFTPNIAGYYQINANIYFNDGGTPVNGAMISIYKNGSEIRRSNLYVTSGGTWFGGHIHDLIYMNGTTDYLELYGQPNGGSGTANFIGDSDGIYTYWSGFLARAA